MKGSAHMSWGLFCMTVFYISKLLSLFSLTSVNWNLQDLEAGVQTAAASCFTPVHILFWNI